MLRSPVSVTESRNLKANTCLLVLSRGTRAIVATDANTRISAASREFTKKINMMAGGIAADEPKFVAKETADFDPSHATTECDTISRESRGRLTQS